MCARGGGEGETQRESEREREKEREEEGEREEEKKREEEEGRGSLNSQPGSRRERGYANGSIHIANHWCLSALRRKSLFKQIAEIEAMSLSSDSQDLSTFLPKLFFFTRKH